MRLPMGRAGRAVLACAVFLGAVHASGQQTQVDRYDVYAGFAGFETPWLNLAQRGVHLQGGENIRPWLSAGFDYSEASGHNTITPHMLTAALQQQLGAEVQGLILAGVLPSNYQLAMPTHAFSQTFAAGPQLEYRHYKAATLFLRPSIGAIRQKVTPHPTDPVSTAIVAQLIPSGSKLDWSGFYGFGGGFDWNATSHVGIRAQADLVYWRLFSDLLANGTWTTRYAVGPTFHFGKNIAAP